MWVPVAAVVRLRGEDAQRVVASPARVFGHEEPCVIEWVAQCVIEMTKALAIGAVEASELTSVVGDQGCQKRGVPEVPVSVATFHHVRGGLEH